MFYEDDLDVLFSDFGIDATFASQTIKVIFDNDSRAVNLDTMSVESSGPQAVVKDISIPGAVHGSTLIIGGVTYYIRGIHPDGTGLTTLILSKD